MEEKVKKKIEIKLRKNIALNVQSQAKSDIGDVIRRRKGEPEKRIFRKLNKQ